MTTIRLIVRSLCSVLVCGVAFAGVNTPDTVVQGEPVGTRNSALVTSTVAPPVKAPSTRSIDPATAESWPADASRGPGARVSNLGGMAKNDGTHMKCWQHGRLIVDKRVKLIPGEVGTANRVRDAETGSEILTFDLKNATCVVQ